MSIFDQMAASHVSYIRLDAVGYGAKEPDSSCFMTPKSFELIGRLREEGVKRGLEILIEVHSYYQKQIEIASKVDRVYDFALPPLLLHSLFTGHVEPVSHWVRVRPNNAVNVLDTHDGIGVIDIGSDQLDRSLKGLIPDEDRGRARPHDPPQHARRIQRRNRRRRLEPGPLPGQQHLLFGARLCNRPALSGRPRRAVLPAGRPAGLLRGRASPVATTWTCSIARMSGATSTATTTPPRRWTRTLDRTVVRALNALCRLRNSLDAFDGEFSYEADGDVSLTLTWKARRPAPRSGTSRGSASAWTTTCRSPR